MKSLAVFDFDRTIVDDDSDATIINRLREKQPPPEWESGNHDWTPYMSDVFEHAYSAGLSEDEILECISGMKATPGITQLLTTLKVEAWDVIILSDANTVFVHHWLNTHHLKDCITEIITNRAFFKGGRLYIEPCMKQTACPRCPSNLCKKLALTQWLEKHNYENIVYVGDGRNDFCPSTMLPAHGSVFPRIGYPLHNLVKETLASPSPLIKANVVPWKDCYTIMKTLFPEKIIS